MGFTSTHNATKADIVRELTSSRENEHGKWVTLAHCLKGTVLWSVVEWTDKSENKVTNVIHCDLLGLDRGFGWGYKDMSEGMSPYYYTCPLKYLDLTPEVASETWRKRVRAYHAIRAFKLEPGKTYNTVPGTSIPEITVTSLKPLRGTYGGRLYRVSKKYIETGLPSPDSILTPRDAATKARLDAGDYLRAAASGLDDGNVHVLFRNKDGRYLGFFMADAAYDAIPLGTDASPDDYRKFGPLETAPPDFDGRTTKEVSFAEFSKDHPEIAKTNAELAAA